MFFQYQKTNKTIEMLNDLIKIHNDRISGYQCALAEANIGVTLYEHFEQIIADTQVYKQQLSQKIKQLNGDPLKGSTILGKIYSAWMVLKVTFPGSTPKAIINSCLYNEEIALHSYNAALSAHITLTPDVRELIESQEDALRTVYSMLNKHKEVRHTAARSLTFFL